MKSMFVVAILIAALAITFALQNSQVVQVHFMYWYFEGALALTLILTFIIGSIAAFFAMMPGFFKRRHEITVLKRQLEQLQKQLDQLSSAQKTAVELNPVVDMPLVESQP